jgi:hypothetical protein
MEISALKIKKGLGWRIQYNGMVSIELVNIDAVLCKGCYITYPVEYGVNILLNKSVAYSSLK